MNALGENISQYISQNFGDEFLESYNRFVGAEFSPYIRISPINTTEEKLVEALKPYGIRLEKVPNVPYAYRVLSGIDVVGKTIEHALGHYYIQSLSSMIPPHVVAPEENDKVLDMCAAPGSKSTQLVELMNNNGTLYVNEPNPSRIKSLVFNIDKIGAVNTGILRYKGEIMSKIFPAYFDKILVDAPCSGLGILQKHGEVSDWWKREHAERLSSQQLKLLVSAIKMAKPGGTIVYSTCTLTLEENEMILNTVLKKYPVELVDIELPLKSHAAHTSFREQELNENINKAHRLIPWEINSEGFFVSKLVKTGDTEVANTETIRSSKTHLVGYNNKAVKKVLTDVAEHYGIGMDIIKNYNYIPRSREFSFINNNWEGSALDQFVRIGIKFGNLDKHKAGLLNSQGAQLLNHHITKNKIELSDPDELNTYFTGGTIRRTVEPYGQKVVVYNGNAVGTAVANAQGIKSQFPRAMRTSEIIIPT